MSKSASLVVVCLYFVLCVGAQTPDQQPTQTQTTTSSNGQPIIINTFLNNTNANSNQNTNTNTNTDASPNANTNNGPSGQDGIQSANTNTYLYGDFYSPLSSCFIN
jgi:hypothetical protein